ncbi:MAG: hypothetical protein LBU15_03655 [Rickettsiales bacterium]|nr:hypothetical protein [Rickettsiales bacterium]
MDEHEFERLHAARVELEPLEDMISRELGTTLFAEGEARAISLDMLLAHPLVNGFRVTGINLRIVEKDLYGCKAKEFEAIASDADSSTFLLPSQRLGGNVVVKIPHVSGVPRQEQTPVAAGRLFSGKLTNDILCYNLLWRGVAPGDCPPELSSLARIFGCASIRYLSTRSSRSGYPVTYAEAKKLAVCGTTVTVSEHCELGSLGSMGRDQARHILLDNDNIYGLFRGLRTLQNLKYRENSVGKEIPCQLVHNDINPTSLMVTKDKEGNHIVKLADWDSVIVVFPKMAEDGVRRFIFSSDDLPGPRVGVDVWERGGGIDGGTRGKDYRFLESGLGMDVRKIDVFSLGLVLLEFLVCGGLWFEDPATGTIQGTGGKSKLFSCYHYENDRERFRDFLDAKLEEAVENGLLSPAIAYVIRWSCEPDAAKRLTPGGLLKYMDLTRWSGETLRVDETMSKDAMKIVIARMAEEMATKEENRRRSEEREAMIAIIQAKKVSEARAFASLWASAAARKTVADHIQAAGDAMGGAAIGGGTVGDSNPPSQKKGG